MSRRASSSRNHLQTLAATLTVTDGPLRSAIDELGRVGIGGRILKSTVAAMLAWLVASLLPRENAPFVAALTALYTMDLTILKSITGAGQRVIGIVLGIAMAFLAAEFFGIYFWSAGLVILFSMLVGMRLKLQPEGIAQVAGTAIVVLVVRSNTEERSIYALTFLADTIIGTAIGLAVNALFMPPNYLPGVHRAIDLLIIRLSDVMEQLGNMVVDGVNRDEVDALTAAFKQIGSDLDQVNTAIENATEALRFNIMAEQQRADLDHLRSVERRLSGVIRALQGLVGSLEQSTDDPWIANSNVATQIADLISASSQVLSAQGKSDSRAQADRTSIQELEDRIAALGTVPPTRSDGRWIREGLVLGSAQRVGQAAIALNRT